MTQGIPVVPKRLLQFRLRGFLVVCVLLAAIAGLGGRWWLRQSLPIVSIENAVCGEGDPLDFMLTLSGESSIPVVVRFATASGTATASLDYVPIPATTIRFEPGETWKTIDVETKRDYDETEGDETVVVKLLSAAGAAFANTQAVGTIVNGPAPAEIAVTRFYGDGANLKIDYTIAGDVWSPFTIAIFVSDDGLSCQQQIAVGDGQTARGNHSLTLSPAFDDFQRDYFLKVMVDSEYGVEEVDEKNNFARFDGGAFLVHEPASGKTVLHIQGRDKDELTSDFTPVAVDEVHFRGHGGNDRFELDAFLPGVPGWLFGGEGDDTLTGSSANDLIFGGPGNDILHGGDGNDMLVGGKGCDKLYGEGGEDQLFGGPDTDQLFDTPKNGIMDGGPGKDLFNGSHHSPTIAPVFDTMRNHYRDVEDERELRIDLKTSFQSFIKAFPAHAWQVDHRGSAIAGCWVNGDVLHVQFDTGVPEDSLLQIRVTARKYDDENERWLEYAHQGSFHVYSIAVTGYKIERKIGPGQNDWIEEKGDLWASDSLRWTPLYEPQDVPIQWDVQWMSKAWEDLDHPHVEWDVFSNAAAGPTPIASPPSGIRAITPQFVFKHSTTQVENPKPAGK